MFAGAVPEGAGLAASVEADASADCVFVGFSVVAAALMAVRVPTSSFRSSGAAEAADKSISRVAGAKPSCEISTL